MVQFQWLRVFLKPWQRSDFFLFPWHVYLLSGIRFKCWPPTSVFGWCSTKDAMSRPFSELAFLFDSHEIFWNIPTLSTVVFTQVETLKERLFCVFFFFFFFAVLGQTPFTIDSRGFPFFISGMRRLIWKLSLQIRWGRHTHRWPGMTRTETHAMQAWPCAEADYEDGRALSVCSFPPCSGYVPETCRENE